MFDSAEKGEEIMNALESDEVLKNMWPIVHEISQAVANESRGKNWSFSITTTKFILIILQILKMFKYINPLESQLKKQKEEDSKEKLGLEVQDLYHNQNNHSNAHSHKRVESMDVQQKHSSIMGHRKSAHSEIEKFIPGFEALKRHDKCKVDITEYAPSAIK